MKIFAFRFRRLGYFQISVGFLSFFTLGARKFHFPKYKTLLRENLFIFGARKVTSWNVRGFLGASIFRNIRKEFFWEKKRIFHFPKYKKILKLEGGKFYFPKYMKFFQNDLFLGKNIRNFSSGKILRARAGKCTR